MLNSVNCSITRLDISEAAQLLQRGGILIYPTETFWAIGCNPDAPLAIDAIYRIKSRFEYKPLPLLAANREQAAQVADLEAAPMELLAKYWPGPLTLLLPARQSIHPHLHNPEGKLAIRVTASAVARMLTSKTGKMLTCSSANIQAHKPGHEIEELDQEFWDACARCALPIAICDSYIAHSKLGSPSTIIEPEFLAGQWRLRIIREGAINAAALQSPEWELVQ